MVQRGIAAAIVCVVLVCLTGNAAGGIRPSFQVDSCAWGATHVVVATEGETINGRFTVIESWVGPLEVGVELQVPELAAFAPLEERKVHEGFRLPEHPVVVTGDRMILFLKQDPSTRKWVSASSWGDLSASVCWIEHGEAYGLIQVINPGDPVMTHLRTDENVLHARVRHLHETKRRLGEIRAIEDLTQRAEQASKFTDADSYVASSEAFEILRGCGRPAVPFLLAIAQRDAPERFWWEALEALGAIGDPLAVPFVVGMLEQELVFWEAAAKTLRRGWWNGKGLEWKQVEHYRFHYSRVHHPLGTLAGIGAPESEDVVRRTRELWRANPALHEIGSRQIEEGCDAALAAIERKRPPPK